MGVDNQKQKKVILILNIILVLGLLAYCAILFIINKNLNPLEILGANYATVHLRLYWRQMAETIFSACSTIYIVGHILVFYVAIRKNILVRLQTIFLYFIAQICLMFMCTVPFGFFDLGYFGDYIFPIWSTAGVLLLLLVVFVIVGLYKKSKRV